MDIKTTFINDLFLIDYKNFIDYRGEFVKTIHADTFNKFNMEYKYDESFFSISNENVIRGMHFQIPPYDHAKLVYVIKGEIIDVVLDLRIQSKTYGKYFFTCLNDTNRQGIYMGKGLAHGFLSLMPDTIVEYHTSTAHNPANETGIHFDSFGFDWKIKNPIVSERDLKFTSFHDFKSPFV
jgi:dTDP-4-dehydrorhamnose 3,5-epimerase